MLSEEENPNHFGNNPIDGSGRWKTVTYDRQSPEVIAAHREKLSRASDPTPLHTRMLNFGICLVVSLVPCPAMTRSHPDRRLMRMAKMMRTPSERRVRAGIMSLESEDMDGCP